MKAPRLSRRHRGSSFIEILVALALLAILMVGILQMYSLSLITNFGSAARTDLLYKAQQVVENLRLVYSLEKLGNGTARVDAGVPSPIAVTSSPIYLPYFNGDSTSLTWSYWGPAGANVVDEERLPYRLSYTVEDYDPIFWLVTVTATPVDNPNLAGTLPVPGANDRHYAGLGSKLKIVTYSAQVEK
ncbi:MAG: prepilin-type N-terminal cleavage/methylation domain-containing protein [Thermoanaerobaculia bacterium]